MKILWILNHYATAPDEPATRSYDFGAELVKRGYQVTIFASSFSHYKFKEKKLQSGERWKIEDCNGVKFIWIKTYPYKKNDWRRALNMLSFAWRVFWVGKRFEEKPDVIIGTSVHLLTVFSAFVLSKIKKSRFFFEVTDLWPQTLIDMGALPERSPITYSLRLLEKFLYQRAEKIITLFPYADEYITNFGISREKIVWIPNGVDLSRYKELKPYQGGTGEKFNILYLGIHAKYAGLDTILKAAQILQNEGKNYLKFILVGDGSEKPNLIQLAKDLNLQNVEFLDMVPKNEVFKIIEKADAFISIIRNIPVLKYGISSNKLNDYLASSRPIIFAIHSRNNPVEEAGAGFTVPPEDPKALVQAIKKLLAMKPEERIKMGKRGLEYVKKYYDIRTLADKLEKLLLGY